MYVIRLIVRALLVGLILLGHALGWFIGWLVLLISLRGLAKRRAWQGDRLRCLLRDLGATYVKIGQIMSTRPDMFPPHIIVALERLQDDVGTFAYRHVRAAFLEEFGKAPEDLFKEFRRAPIASASVSQVHVATMHDGTKVAVKVRRPGIDKIVDFDLSMLLGLARFLELFPVFRLYAPREGVMEFGKAIGMQVDLRIEAENNKRFQKNFANNKEIILPDLIPSLCSKRVLTMTFIEGTKILQYQKTDADPTTLALIGFRTLLQMIFEDGFVHADLHPGNILIATDGRVALLDLGLTAALEDEDRLRFAQFFGAWARGDGKTMARWMVQFSSTPKVRDYEGYEAEICEFVGRYYGKKLGEVGVSQVIFDMMGIMRRHKVRLNATFTMVNIAIAVTEGIGRQLDDTLDLLTEAAPFFVRLQQAGKLGNMMSST